MEKIFSKNNAPIRKIRFSKRNHDGPAQNTWCAKLL